MAERITVQRFTLENGVKNLTHFKFEEGEYKKLRFQVNQKFCDCCGDWFIIPHKNTNWYWYSTYYSDPWNNGAPDTEETYCSEDCYESANQSDFSPEYCEECERYVIQRCPQNGYRGYFMFNPMEEDSCDLICVACYQKLMVENGHPEWHLEDDRCHADFYNESELQDAGFVVDTSYFVPSDMRLYQSRGKELQEAGYKVITNLDSSGMGLEGHITLWKQEQESEEQ